MIVTFDRSPTSCAVRCACSHSSVVILSGQMTARTSSSRISAAVPGSVASPASLARSRYSREVHVEALRTLGDLERGEAVHVDVGRDLLHRPGDVEVVVAVEVGVDPALEADLGRAALDRLDHAALHLGEVEQVRVAAQVQRQRTLRERAEPALERADVRVVDVAVADERDVVADDVAPELVGDGGDLADLRTACAEQRDDLGLVDGLAGAHAVEHLGDPPTRCRASTATSVGPSSTPVDADEDRRRDVATARPRVVAREALEVRRVAHRGAHVGVQPLVLGRARTPGTR